MNGTFKDLSIFLVFPGEMMEWGLLERPETVTDIVM
jgi:hypothetical protein